MKFFVCLCASRSLLKARSSMHAVRSFTFGSLFCSRWLHSAGKPWRQVTSPSACARPPAPTTSPFKPRVTAVELLSAPRTVRVCPGTYTEQVSITSALTLEGTAAGTTDAAVVATPPGGLVTNGSDILRQPGGGPDLCPGCDRGHGFAYDGGPAAMISWWTARLTRWESTTRIPAGSINNNAVRNVLMPSGLQGCQGGLAINVESDSGTPAITISNNSVRNYDKNGITASQRPRDRRRARGHSFGEHGHRYRRYWGYRPEWHSDRFRGDGHGLFELCGR